MQTEGQKTGEAWKRGYSSLSEVPKLFHAHKPASTYHSSIGFSIYMYSKPFVLQIG